MSARTHGGPAPELAIQEAIVDALSDAGLAEDAPSRLLLLRLIGQILGQPLAVADQPIGRNHLIELVTACALIADGMDALMNAVAMLRPRSNVYVRVRQLVLEPQVRDLLPASELERLREWLGNTHVSQLPTLVRRAAGHAVVPPSQTRTVWHAFLYLADLNAGPDGVPPALLFLEHVACQVGGVLAANLHRWNDEQARRLGRLIELHHRRANVSPIAADTLLHLLIVIQHDGIDPDRWLLSHWRQDDPEVWPPPHGGSLSAQTADLESVTDSLIVDAERAWSGHSGTVALEFVLPRALLNLPVHRWHKEHASGEPKPLSLDYPIVLRSLERMRSAHWHRVWRGRWQDLIDKPSPGRIYVGRPTDGGERHRVDAILSDPQWIMMILATPPGEVRRPGSDELIAALRAGLPALIWHPSAPSVDVYEIIMSLINDNGRLVDLPRQVQALRNRTFAERDAGIIPDLVLLWDDPFRLVAVDLAPNQPVIGEGA